jgi:O-antigen/teichoic acid export membrane protein
MIEQELRNKSIAALNWSAGEALSRAAASFVIVVVLARLLSPEEFGIIAVISLLTTAGSVIADGGFGAALVQGDHVSTEETSSVFYFNVAISFCLAILLCLCAPWIAAYFKMPVIAPLTRFLALNLFIDSFGSVHSALLIRELKFKVQMKISAVVTPVSGLLAIWLAWRGWGVWSLAFQALVATVVSTWLLWRWIPWRPALVFRVSALRALFRFGSYLLLSGLTDAVFTRLYVVLVAKFHSARDLGYYTRAETTQQMPAGLLTAIIDRVAFPLFSSVAADKDLLRRSMRKAVVSMMAVNIPLFLGFAAAAKPFVLVFFGSKWAPCILLLQVRCLCGLIWPLHVINLSLLKSMGRSDLFFRVELIKRAIGVPALLGAAAISILALAWCSVLLSLICFGVNAYYIGVLLNYSALRQVRDILRHLFAGVCMAACVWAPTAVHGLAPALLLAIQVLLGVGIYLGICRLLKLGMPWRH